MFDFQLVKYSIKPKKDGRWRVLNKEAKGSTGRIRAQNGKVFTSYSGSKSTWLNIMDNYEDESLRYLESINVEESFLILMFRMIK